MRQPWACLLQCLCGLQIWVNHVWHGCLDLLKSGRTCLVWVSFLTATQHAVSFSVSFHRLCILSEIKGKDSLSHQGMERVCIHKHS